MRRVAVLSAALLLWCGVAFAQNLYIGSTGSRSANFVLNWARYGDRVTGYYYTDDDPDYHYRLVGHNYSNGRLVLREFDQGETTAVIRLHKTVRNGQIRWVGTMYNTDGRRIPVSFSRE